MNLPLPIRLLYTPYPKNRAYRLIRLYISTRGRWQPVAFVVYSEDELASIYVRPKYRRTGVGKFLLRCVLHEADAKGWHLLLEVSEEFGMNENSLIKWYRNFGFRVTHRPSFGQRLVQGDMTEMERRPVCMA